MPEEVLEVQLLETRGEGGKVRLQLLQRIVDEPTERKVGVKEL